MNPLSAGRSLRIHQCHAARSSIPLAQISLHVPSQMRRAIQTRSQTSRSLLQPPRAQPVRSQYVFRPKHFSTCCQRRQVDAKTSSVSPNEVDHFSRLASSWWDPHGPSRLLHLMNPLRFDFIHSLLPRTTNSSNQKQYSYLDIGCGGGIFASACARHPSTSSVTAIDPTPACISVAQQKQRTDPSIAPPKLTYLNTAIESLPPNADGSPLKYDMITVFEVLEHITHPAAFLETAARHLKPGGWIVGSTIARSPMSYITTKLIAEAPVIGVVPAGTHDWNQYINPGELRSWFEKSEAWGNFTTQGVIYVPALGWRVVAGSEGWGNYFFGVQKKAAPSVQDASADGVY